MVKDESNKEYTKEEVAKAKESGTELLIINGVVYDITEFKHEHPGGKAILLSSAGKDVSEEFEMLHRPDILKKFGAKLKVGVLKKNPTSASTFTVDDVKNDDRKLIIISNKVYDVSQFASEHPGGKAILLSSAGKDVTEEFSMLHRPDILRKFGNKLQVGVIGEKKEEAKTAERESETKNERHFGRWFPGQSPNAEAPSLEPMEQSWNSGGTSHLLPRERERATFSVNNMTLILDDFLEENSKRRRWLWSEQENFDNSMNLHANREEVVRNHLHRFIHTHKKYSQSFIPKNNDILMMRIASRNGGAMALHYGAFLPTLLAHCNQEQAMEWVLPASQMQIIGCLGQTELGHGSNVRAIQTTAEYDKETEEFILNTPTLRAMKWWPGGLGKTSTHTALYAQLLLDGKSYGLHTFIVQLRDENHVPLPGITLGEIGPKIGDNGTETGYLRLQNVRIPRKWMMMKNQEVTPDGVYQRTARAKKAGSGAAKKMMYSTMLSIRAGLVMGAGYKLAQGVTVGVRYSVVRQQGFKGEAQDEKQKQMKDSRASVVPQYTHLAPEKSVLDYQIQSYRILKQLALAYAMVFTGKDIMAKLKYIKNEMDNAEVPDLTMLPEIHASSSGLKALCTLMTADGLEDIRKSCGGHGVMIASGIAQMFCDYVTVCTAEGDATILELQSAKFLLKALGQAKSDLKTDLIQEGSICSYLRRAAEEYQSNKSSTPSWLSDECPYAGREAFLDLRNVRELFRWRALVAVTSADGRLQKEKNVDENQVALDLRKASRAHCFLVILESFLSYLKKVEEHSEFSKELQVLKKVCLLFALSHIEDNIGDWMGYLSREQKSDVEAGVRFLLEELRPDAVALVDAFEFPDNVLNSALGRYDGNVYEALFASAQASGLNAKDPLPSVKEELDTVLDKDFIREHAKQVRYTPAASL